MRRVAITKPASDLKAALEPRAVEHIRRRDEGLSKDARAASKLAIATLDESFFRVGSTGSRRRRESICAMAELGPGPHRSGGIAAGMKRDVTSPGPTRNQLIAKGMIWSPNHGDTAFTVPLFDEFMRRIMPKDWR
jgi:hypothetical protein